MLKQLFWCLALTLFAFAFTYFVVSEKKVMDQRYNYGQVGQGCEK